MGNNLKVVKLNVARNSTYEEVVPEGYVRLITRERVFSFIPQRTKFFVAGETISLNPGSYNMVTIKVGEELEYSKIIDFRVAGSFKGKSETLLMIVQGNYTEATSVATKVHRGYSIADPGIFSEFDESVECSIYRINQALRDLSDANVKKAQELIQHSLYLIAEKYGIAKLSVRFEKFD